jgi:outer membrane protein OmpA-like peptidoglycan-associated protein/peptidoglycan hydrolase-like protein with peptidoglycan-binding domain
MAAGPESGETRITRRDVENSWQRPTDRSHVFRLERFQCHVLEMEDVHFHHDSAVLLPDHGDCGKSGAGEAQRIAGLGVLEACFRHAKAQPKQKLLLAGHTDTSGKPAYNLTLSELRAKNVRALLVGDRDTWVGSCEEKHKVRDVQQILTWADAALGWGCDPEGIDDDRGPKTIASTKAFQGAYNRVFDKQIAVDGDVGTETWGAFFDACQLGLRERLEAKDEAELAAWRKQLRWLDAARPFVGCGENHPIDAPEKPNHRSQTNRRVELLFFDPDQEPRLDCHPGPGACDPKLCELYDPGCYRRDYIVPEPIEEPEEDRLLLVPLDLEGEPRRDTPYVLEIGGAQRSGRTDGEGLLDEPIPPGATAATLRVGEGEDEEEYEIRIDELDPIEDAKGVQVRLVNLGFDPGPVDGRVGPRTQKAIRAFQDRFGLGSTGEVDDATRAALAERAGL